MTLGQKLTPILVELENTMLEHAVAEVGAPEFSDEAVSAACMIFQTVLMDRMYKHQGDANMSFKKRCEAAEWFGTEIRSLMKQATGIDSHDLYKKTMTQLEKLTKEIQRLVPELMELSFGCKFIHVNGDELTYIGSLNPSMTQEGISHPWIFANLKKHETFRYEWEAMKQNYVKILGHPITLFHICTAFRRKEQLVPSFVVDEWTLPDRLEDQDNLLITKIWEHLV